MTKPNADFLKGRIDALDEILGLLCDVTCDAYMAGRDAEAESLRNVWRRVVARSKEAAAAFGTTLCNKSDPNERYGFDDLYIGIAGDSSIVKPLVSRPKGLTNTNWYKFAGEIIGLLNPKEAS